jgi:hypothetical protein
MPGASKELAMNKGGFSWNRLTGVTRLKQQISRKLGIPLTKSGRQRKIGGMFYRGKGCLITILLIIALISISFVAIHKAYSINKNDCVLRGSYISALLSLGVPNRSLCTPERTAGE